MGYAILRCQKLKSGHAVRRSLAHALREQDTPNADPARTPDNTQSAASVADGLAAFNDRLATQAKVRSNAVLAVEYLITASPEDMRGKGRAEQDAYFADARKWIEARHGAENVVAWGIHRDEQTPHLYAVVVPIDDRGKLNCRAFLGGAKALSEMQTDFAERVGRSYGLARGIEGSKARHQTVKAFYAALEHPTVKHVEITPEALKPQGFKEGLWGKIGMVTHKETPEGVAERLTLAVQERYTPAIQAAAGAREMAQKAREAQETARSLQERLKPVLDALRPLTGPNRVKVGAVVAEAGKRLLESQERAKEEAERQRQVERQQKQGKSRGR